MGSKLFVVGIIIAVVVGFLVGNLSSGSKDDKPSTEKTTETQTDTTTDSKDDTTVGKEDESTQSSEDNSEQGNNANLSYFIENYTYVDLEGEAIEKEGAIYNQYPEIYSFILYEEEFDGRIEGDSEEASYFSYSGLHFLKSQPRDIMCLDYRQESSELTFVRGKKYSNDFPIKEVIYDYDTIEEKYYDIVCGGYGLVIHPEFLELYKNKPFISLIIRTESGAKAEVKIAYLK